VIGLPTPAFKWNDYEVPAHPGGNGPELLAPEAAPATVTVSIPDLSAWPTPLEKAEILLQSAAEVEHALMVQYLYAAYSLKTVKDVTDPAQKAVLTETSPTAWPQVLLGIAREEMGHLMTVQNLLLLLGLAPNFEREDFPPRKDLYPFALNLEPLTRRSLAKYVVAEAAMDAAGIDDIITLAKNSVGAPINRVGVLYGLLGLVFTAAGDVDSGATGDAPWDAIVRRLAVAAHQQAATEAWHLRDKDFRTDSLSHQADPEDWQVAHLRVHRVADRAAAVQAIRDIGEQGEGPTTADELSHFARFLGMFRGQAGVPPFPGAAEWLPTRDVPTNPKVQDITEPRTRRWAELADIRYALLLGLLEHYLLGDVEERGVLSGWIFAEMRARLGFIARELTAMPRVEGRDAAGAAAIPFTLPADLHLPSDESGRWAVHHRRTEAAIAKVEEMLAADAGDGASAYLASLLDSDRARIELMTDPASRPIPTSFARDILPLFRLKDAQHMNFKGVDLQTYDGVRASAALILDRVSNADAPMPPPPDQRWTKAQTDLFERWIAEDFPS
jgi:Ferritin-like